ncbi:MAG TPA: FG-GAP-like repeat-containing protein [Kiritimatiellia bacterium]|nr:FG-GAP-like repeat-containing protein [Kiritimatiellia bacterium]
MKRFVPMAWMLAVALNASPATAGFLPARGSSTETLASTEGTFTLIEGLHLDGGFLYYGQGRSIQRLNLGSLAAATAGSLPVNASIGGIAVASGRLVAGFGTSFNFPFPSRIGFIDGGGSFVDQAGTDGLYDMAVDPVSGALYVVINPGAAGTQISRYDPVAGSFQPVIAIGGFSGGIAFDASGHLFVAEQFPARVLRFSPAALAGGGLTAADGAVVVEAQVSYMTFDTRGRLYTVRGFGNELVVTDPATGEDLRTAAIDEATGFGIGKIVWDPLVNSLYVAYADFGQFFSRLIELVAPAVRNDFDRDGWSDLAVYRPFTGEWAIQHTEASFSLFRFNRRGGVPVAGDFDGDSFADPAVYHGRSGTWRIHLSSTGEEVERQWGWKEAQPVPGDYDGDGITDLAVYHPGSGNWFILLSSNGELRRVNWGWSAAVPVPADYDGDGITDLAVYHPAAGDWYILRSSDGQLVRQNWGWREAQPVPADYDGDGRADIAVYHPRSATWYVLPSGGGAPEAFVFGPRLGIPVVADYDGDGRANAAVYERRTGRWSIRSGRLGDIQHAFGTRQDVPVR